MKSRLTREKLLSALLVLAGLAALAAYWYQVHPPGFARSYADDWCVVEQTRQIMGESVSRFGGPRFFADQFGAPAGISLPYMPWGVEISWIGAYFWNFDRDIPFHWLYFGFSLAISFLGVGYILRRMKLSPLAAWGVALLAVLGHVPRHFKIWHHYEHLIQHWVYWSLFLDAWIYQRFWREKKWSWSLEAWRALLLLGTFNTAGYYWGPMLLEWFLVRVFMHRSYRQWKRAGVSLEVNRNLKAALLPVGLAIGLLVIDLRWFIPLLTEAWKVGKVGQGLGSNAPWWYFIRPLWLDSLFKVTPFTEPETVVTIGWIFWVPVALGISRLRKKNGGPGLKIAQPFLVYLAIAIAYASMDPPVFARILRGIVPFMIFFRVLCRWGLLLPPLLGALLALCWPELSAWVRRSFRARPALVSVIALAFVASSAGELSWLRTPITGMPPLPDQAVHLLEDIKRAPGTAVLDLPFCLTGGNGACTGDTCQYYPKSTVGACLRGWHDKNVYGASTGRLSNEQCDIYRQEPFVSWNVAWKQGRCFNTKDWEGFCGYLDKHSELSAVLLYPDIWSAVSAPSCLAELEARLGPPRGEAVISTQGTRIDRFAELSRTRVIRYGTRCRIPAN